MSQIEDGMMKYLKRRSGLIIFVTVIMLSLCSCVGAASCDEGFRSFMEITPASQKALKSGFQNVNAEAEYEDVTLRVTETLGDGKALYAVLEIDFSKNVNFKKVLEASKEEFVSFDVNDITMYNGRLTPDDIDKAVAGAPDKPFDRPGEINTGALTIMNNQDMQDLANGKAKILFGVTADGNADITTGGEVTFVLDDLQYYTEKYGCQKLAEGRFTITWTPTNKLEIKCGHVYDGGQKAADIMISPIHVFLRNVKEKTLMEQLSSTDVKIKMADGTFCELSGSGSDLDWNITNLDKVINLDAIDSVNVGPYTVEFEQ